MIVEVTAKARETFESRATASGIELSGSGRLTRLRIDFPGWLTPHAVDDAVGIDVWHEAGVSAKVRFRSGQRLRIEITLESATDDLVVVPGPILSVEGHRRAVSWFAGASGEILLPSQAGPGLLTQRRGISSPSTELGSGFPLEEEVSLRARHVVSAAWTYETFEGGLFDAPAEPSWLPWVRYVERGYPVQIVAPDGVVTVDNQTRVDEIDEEFEVYPADGLTTVGLWGAGGQTRLEIGGYRELPVLRELVVRHSPHTDEWCYVSLRHLLESTHDDDLLDRVDFVLGERESQPTAWSAVACKLATQLGLPLGEQALAAATAVLANGRPDDVLLLALHHLVPVDITSGAWPIGDFDAMGVEAISALSYGRITTDPPRGTGRDVAVAKLYSAAHGESERGLMAATYAQAAEGRLLAALSVKPSAADVAWLSIQ